MTTKRKAGYLASASPLSEVVGNLVNEQGRTDTHAVGIYDTTLKVYATAVS